MPRSYITITELSVAHTYYSDLKCDDLKVVPTQDALSVMQNYRLRWGGLQKARTDTYQLVQEGINPTTALIPIPNDFMLRFHVTSLEKDFENFTQGLARNANEIWVWENDNAGSLIKQKLPFFSRVAIIEGLTAPKTITITGPDGASFIEESYPDGTGHKASIELANKPPGIYSFTWAGGALTAYFDPDIKATNALGILHLRQSTSPLYTIGTIYKLGLEAVELNWKYYLLLKKEYTSQVFTFTASGQPFVAYTPGANEPSLLELKDMNQGITVLAFASQNPIPFSDTPLSIKLEHDVSNYVVKSHLPNPERGSANAAVFVRVDLPIN